MQYLLYEQDEDSIKNIDIGHVMVIIESAWDQITAKTIKNCWVKSTLFDLVLLKKKRKMKS